MDHERTAQRNDADHADTRTLLVITGLLLVGLCIELCGFGGLLTLRYANQMVAGEGCSPRVPLLQQCDATSWDRCHCWWIWEEPVPVNAKKGATFR